MMISPTLVESTARAGYVMLFLQKCLHHERNALIILLKSLITRNVTSQTDTMLKSNV